MITIEEPLEQLNAEERRTASRTTSAEDDINSGFNIDAGPCHQLREHLCLTKTTKTHIAESKVRPSVNGCMTFGGDGEWVPGRPSGFPGSFHGSSSSPI